MHFTYSIILKSPSGSIPKSHFRQFKQRQATASLSTWKDGRKKNTTRNSSKAHQCYFFQ